MQLSQVLFSQGFGTRRECEHRILAGTVSVNGQICDDPDKVFETPGLTFEVDGRPWPFHAQASILLHKPAGYECSMKPRHHPSVMSLLPAPLRLRSGGGLQPVGRLDEDTTGVLLLTDDGPLIHRLTSPRHHVAKVYEVTTRHPVDHEQVQALIQGVVLDDSPHPVQAQACEHVDDHHLRLTLTEGKYHQVKRMVAAVGNRVEALHRSAVGAVTLPENLAPGQWCWLDASMVG